MPTVPSIMSLHLCYRLWIAEMNFNIDVLRIFDDYLAELALKKNEPEVKTGIDHFLKQFTDMRKEIDELRHEMHIRKMKLGAYSREMKQVDPKTYEDDDHDALQKRYFDFREVFDKLKSDFSKFEGRWLN